MDGKQFENTGVVETIAISVDRLKGSVHTNYTKIFSVDSNITQILAILKP